MKIKAVAYAIIEVERPWLNCCWYTNACYGIQTLANLPRLAELA